MEVFPLRFSLRILDACESAPRDPGSPPSHTAALEIRSLFEQSSAVLCVGSGLSAHSRELSCTSLKTRRKSFGPCSSFNTAFFTNVMVSPTYNYMIEKPHVYFILQNFDDK